MTAVGPSQSGHSAPSGGSEAWGSSETAVGPLAAIGVLVTRPVEQADGLLAHLRELGAQPFLFPTLAIFPTTRPQALADVLRQAERFDLHLFVSPTAVQFGLAALPPALLAGLRAAAVGNGTAAALRAAGCRDILAPDRGADSEHLLALPALARLAGQRVLIFRGEGGRELIADTLRARGATVEYAECYRRARPRIDPAPLLHAFAQRQIQAITVFSRETLDNLLAMLPPDGQAEARALPLFAPHARIAEHARALDFSRVMATAPGEAGVLAGLVEYFGHD